MRSCPVNLLIGLLLPRVRNRKVKVVVVVVVVVVQVLGMGIPLPIVGQAPNVRVAVVVELIPQIGRITCRNTTRRNMTPTVIPLDPSSPIYSPVLRPVPLPVPVLVLG